MIMIMIIIMMILSETITNHHNHHLVDVKVEALLDDHDHDYYHDDLVRDNHNDNHHLVDVKVETLLHPALRLLELLLQVHHLIPKMS